jgi:hypothetical protein
LKPLISYYGVVVELDEMLFVSTNKMNKPSIIQ